MAVSGELAGVKSRVMVTAAGEVTMQGTQIEVEVVFALPREQRLISLQVPAGTTALEAVRLSGILEQFPVIDLTTASLGIFSRRLDGRSAPLAQDYVLQPRDRVEIYRPLLIDPKQARMNRASVARRQARQKRDALRFSRRHQR